MKFADQRKQYKNSQAALKANEEIIKGLRRQLSAHLHIKKPAIEALLPKAQPRQLMIAMLDTDPRAGAAYQPFGIRVQGLKTWYTPDSKIVKELTKVMKPDGWKTTGLQFTNADTHWYIDFT